MNKFGELRRLLCLLLALLCFMTQFPLSFAADGSDEEAIACVSYAEPPISDGVWQPPVSVLAQEVDGNGFATSDPVEPEVAVAQLQQALVDREASFAVNVIYDKYLDTEAMKQYVHEIYQEAIAHTGVPNEGDYIRFNGCAWGGRVGRTSSDGHYVYKISYQTITYYTTAAQEALVDAEVDRVLALLDLGSASDYEKVKGIYDYICDTVTYDYTNLYDDAYTLKYTSYAAFIDKTAVCQGYATMFYRLALELGVDARVITGIGNGGGHGWNIVEIGGQYYNLDATWDAGRYFYSYFLRSTANFGDHTRDAAFETTEFHALYPTGTSDYSAVLDPANGLLASGSCGSNCTWTLRTDNILRITGSGDMYAFTAGNAPWSQYAYRIQGIEMSHGITSVGDYAFYGCKALAEVQIPSSVTKVGTAAFSGCLYLSRVQFMGNAPAIGSDSFTGVTATAGYYNNGSWNSENMLQYGGTLTWEKLTGYTVQFQDWDGTVLHTWTGGLGDTVTQPDPPTRESDLTYSYLFAGWDKAVVPCNGNAVYTATYYRSYIEYIITFQNADGSLIGIKTFHYGDPVVPPTTVPRPEGLGVDQVFKGWEPEIAPCTGNSTYKAVFGASAVKGDLTGDNEVNNDDVIALLWYTLFPADYPISGSGDLTGDNEVNNDDVIALLWYTLFPDDYPLA